MKEKKIIWDKDGSEMVLIPAGSFEMGDHFDEVDVTTSGPDEHGAFSCRGSGVVCGGIGDGDTAISGRFTMRPVRVLGAAAAKLQESETTCS